MIYPCVANDKLTQRSQQKEKQTPKTLISLNRYERKKNITLAVEAMAYLTRNEGLGKELRLVIAGGYDERLRENIEYFSELEELVKTNGLKDSVTLLRNVSDSERRNLLRTSLAVLYTPSNEHFGIVPLEAMALGVPVIATNTGGPTESIENGVTGYLCESTDKCFSDAIIRLLNDPALAMKMGNAGTERVTDLFSRTVMGVEFQNILVRLCHSRR